ncbi:MAG: bifunctional phosphoserine phosphatase/homoserine phosphotransferase ThrH [Gammaproteobacteria bacterium]
MNIACLDFEGVLIPEIWLGLADTTGIDELRVTTREISDYDELMRLRLDIMARHNLKFADIRAAADALEPLPGAADFLAWLRTEYQVAIISDTFYELAGPLIEKLNYPMILCHKLIVDEDGVIGDYKLRQPDPKRCSVQAFHSLQYKVAATGDSYNDISMLQEADYGVFFCPPDNVVADFPTIDVARSYDDLKQAFRQAKQSFAQ